MMTTTDNDRWLDDVLSEPLPPIADNGFSRKLVQDLQRRQRLVALIPVIFGIIGFGLAWFLAGSLDVASWLSIPRINMDVTVPISLIPFLLAGLLGLLFLGREADLSPA